MDEEWMASLKWYGGMGGDCPHAHIAVELRGRMSFVNGMVDDDLETVLVCKDCMAESFPERKNHEGDPDRLDF